MLAIDRSVTPLSANEVQDLVFCQFVLLLDVLVFSKKKLRSEIKPEPQRREGTKRVVDKP